MESTFTTAQRDDLFILLSSLKAVIGMSGQANCASGNTYQDALARHRIAMGEKAVAVDLGMMLDVGLVAESRPVQNSVNAKNFFIGVTFLRSYSCLVNFIPKSSCHGLGSSGHTTRQGCGRAISDGRANVPNPLPG